MSPWDGAINKLCMKLIELMAQSRSSLYNLNKLLLYLLQHRDITAQEQIFAPDHNHRPSVQVLPRTEQQDGSAANKSQAQCRKVCGACSRPWDSPCMVRSTSTVGLLVTLTLMRCSGVRCDMKPPCRRACCSSNA